MAAPRRSRQAQQPTPTWAAPALAVVGVLVGAVVLGLGYPGVMVTWLLVTVAAWIAPPAQFTGKKDASGFPTAAHAGETRAMQRYRFWADLKYRLIVPPSAILPGWPVYASWFYGLWAAAVVWCLPYAHVPHVGSWPRHIDAFFAFALVTQIAAARRRTVAVGDTSPGVTFGVWKQLCGADRRELVLGTAAGVSVAAVVAVLADWTLPTPPLPVAAEHAWHVLGAIGGFGAGVAWWWVRACLTPWRILVAAREEWAPRWQMLKHDPAPTLTKREKVGNATVDTFTAPASMGAMAYWPLGPKVVPTMGAGLRLAILSTPNTDSQGQPVPGTRHPLNFQVVYWPADAVPDITALDVDEAEAALFIQCAVVWAADAAGFARPVIDQAIPLALTSAPEAPEHTPEAAEGSQDAADGIEPGAQPTPPAEPAAAAAPLPTSSAQAWATSWHLPDGPPMSYIRRQLRLDIAGQVQAEVIVDHRSETIYLGALTDGRCVIDPNTGVDPNHLDVLTLEDTWNGRWADVLKQDVNPPTLEAATYAEATLANGVTVHRQAFVTLLGVDPMDFFGLEAKIAATLQAAPYVAVCGWASGDPNRIGERHPQAFTVYWSHQPVPANPDAIAPPARGNDQAARWVLAGRINEAFKQARLAKPEIHRAQCLTQPRSRGHIWKMTLRLYGGVTLADVRGAAQRIRQALGSEWLRVEAAPDGCVLVAGASPAKVQLTNPRRDTAYLASLDWEQAFIDAKVVGVGGVTPTLTAVDRLPNNEQVQVLDFTLPTGLAFIDVKAAARKLETASRNAFVEVRRHPSGKADAFRILASETNPMPERADVDWDAAQASDHRIPFATNLFGEPTCYDNKVDAHLLVSGVSGGGKLQPLHTRIPVPVSERFPDGWATIGSLELGDLVYTPDGTVAAVNAFSPIQRDKTYRFHLSDGQVVESGSHHLWKVSTQKSRSMHRGQILAHREARYADYMGRAADLRALAAGTGPEHVATLMDIARLLGMQETSLYQMNLPLDHLGIAAQVPSNKKSRVFDVEAVCDYFDAQVAKKERTGKTYTFAGHVIERSHIAGVREAGAKMDGWLTSRAITDALLGKESDRRERNQMKQIVQRQEFAHRDGLTTFTTRVFPVDEVLVLVAEHYEALATTSDSRRAAMPLLDILSSDEIAAAGTRKGFAIRRPEPLKGEAIDAPVDPYVLGAWLGDGRTNMGQFAADPKPSRLDIERRPDANHIKAQVAARYEVRGVPSSEFAVTAVGLTTDLRTAGVLGDKHIPAVYLRASYDQRLALLQGLMDTDGTVNADGQCEIDLCNERLARDVQELLRTLGVFTTLRRKPAKITEDDPENPGQKWQRQTGWRWCQKFTTDLPVFRLPRKVARLKATEDLRSTNDWLYINRIEVVEDQEMRCIGLNHASHQYLTDGFVPTHNSVTLQNFIYGALIRGWDLWVVDPSKGAVDFNFAEPYARAVGRSLWEAKGIIAAIYEEVLRRKAINSEHNCGNYRDLPEEVRYNHVLIVLDEFTSMMLPEPVPKAMDDSIETLRAVESVKAANAAKAFIGSYVGKIVREARSTGFTMLLATQALKADTLAKIPGANDLKDNMSRMILGRASFGQLQAALKMPTEVPEQPEVLPPGRGLYEGNGRPAETIQTWFEPSQQVFAQHLADRVEPLPADRRLDMSQFVEPELEIDGAVIDESVPLLAPVEKPAGEPQVTDLGEIELSLDDLEGLEGLDLSLDDLEQAASNSAPDQSEETGGQPDVDADGLDWSDALPAPGHEPAPDGAHEPDAGPEEGVAVDTLAVWDEIDPSAWEPQTSAYGWTEIDALVGFLDEFPMVREVAWDDPHLDDEDEMGVTFREIVADLLVSRGVHLRGPEDPGRAESPERPEAGVETESPGPVNAPAPVPASAPSSTAPFVDDQVNHETDDETDDEIDDEFGPLPKVPAHLLPESDEF